MATLRSPRVRRSAGDITQVRPLRYRRGSACGVGVVDVNLVSIFQGAHKGLRFIRFIYHATNMLAFCEKALVVAIGRAYVEDDLDEAIARFPPRPPLPARQETVES